MKRLLLIAAPFALAACGSSEPEPAPTPTPTPAQPRTLVAADLDLSTLGAKIVGPQGPEVETVLSAGSAQIGTMVSFVACPEGVETCEPGQMPEDTIYTYVHQVTLDGVRTAQPEAGPEVVAAAGCPIVLMHAPGAGGEDLHAKGDYNAVVFDVFDALRARRDAAIEAGIEAKNIMLDVGIGFGKSLADNLSLINALPMFHALGHPLLFGASRKRMIGALSKEAPVEERLGGSVALALEAMRGGAQVVRVHDVPETVQARNVWRGLRDAALTDFSDLPG